MSLLRQSAEAFRTELEREWRFIIATFAASGTGYLGSAAAPFIVEALIQAGLSHRQAGDLGTIELTTLALGTILTTPIVPHVSHRKLAVGGVLVAAMGLVISALSEAYLPMIVGRVIIGTGSALAIAGANAAIAAREDAERVFAIIWTMGGAITALLSLGLPKLVAGGNYPGGFWVLLMLCAAALPLVFWVPHQPPSLAGAGETSGDPRVALEDPTPAGRFGAFGPMAMLVLAAIFVYSVAEQMLWQFSYELAVDAGIPGEKVGPIIGFTVAMGLVGGAIAAWLGLRLGRSLPLVIGTLFSVAGRWIFIEATTTDMLWAGGLLWGLGFYFVSPYQIGLAAAIDRRGRVAVASAGASNLGYGLGPTIAGRIRQYQVDHELDHSMLILVIAGGTALSLLLLLPMAIRADRTGGSREICAAAQ
jgi:DHA1 family inner membrane transport protein